MKNSYKISRNIIIAVLILFSSSLIAQTSQENPLPQFLFNKFTRGIVKMKAGTKFTANMNYNMVDEEMIFEQKGVYQSLQKPEEIDTVFMQNRVFIPFEKHFNEILSSGVVTVFTQHKSKYVQTGTPTAYGLTSPTNSSEKVTVVKGSGNQFRTVDVPDNVTVSPASVNWLLKNGKMEKFANERGFLKLFPEKETELKAFIKKNNINIKVREDLIKLSQYTNELLSQ